LATCFLLRPWSWFFKRPIISLVYYSTLRYVTLRYVPVVIDPV
jgi:hypothetical protein